MKLLIIILILFTSPVLLAQTYNLKDYPNGTKTIEVVKSQYTIKQIQEMLNNAELCRNIKEKQKIGMKLQDPNTLENILVSDTDSMFLLFAYLEKLRMEVVNLKQRLVSAGIP